MELRLRIVGLVLLAAFVSSPPAWADEPGLDELNRATQQRVSAQSPDELQRVADLCEAALEKGLSDANQQYAKQLLASVLFERAERLVGDVIEGREVAQDPRRAVEQARQSLERIFELEVNHPDARLLAAQLYALEDNREAALEHLDEAVRMLREQRGDVELLVEAMMLRARLRDDFDSVLAELSEAIELAPDNLDIRFMRAQLQIARGRLEDAKTDVDFLLEQAPDLVQVNLLALLLAEQQDRPEDAVIYLRRLLRVDPQNVQLRIQLAASYGQMQHYRRAFEVIDPVIDEQPDNAVARATRADLWLHMGHHEEAIADYEHILGAHDDLEVVLNNLAWLLATSPEDRLRDGQRALELARKAAELSDHEEAYILSTLAAAYAETGDFESARKWAAKAVELGPEDLLPQLREELESFEREEPWREKYEKEDRTPDAEAREVAAPVDVI